ncbi:hemicentin-1-like isoform X2 [Tachypleus tridentatus]|uniref:hemicentin-1-like isoform X2 n=1 Tax=Tachypleus tridentatus TaxID=6853 RepID=UPI003FD01F5A
MINQRRFLNLIICCFLFPFCVKGKDTSLTVTGLVEESAELPCNVDVASCGEVYFITWTKNMSSDWKRLYLYSDDVEKPLQELANPDRADFIVQESTAHLIISPLRMEDEGSYKCDVTYVQGKCPSLSYANLIVMAKPSSPVISKDGEALDNASTVGPYIEGDTLSLKCVSAGGKPAPEVTWWNGSDSLPSRSGTTNEEPGTSNVTSSIDFVISRSDLGAKLECRVKNDAIEHHLTSWVELDVHVKPSSLEIEGPTVPVTSGDTVWLTCTVVGAKPAAKVTWYNHTKVVEPQPQSSSELMSDGTLKTVSQLEITVSQFDHQGTFFCEGTNSVMEKKGDASLLKSIDLEVLYSPVVEVQPAGGLIVNETNKAELFCTFKANPSNISDVIWYKDGLELPLEEDERFELNDPGVPTMTIQNVSRNDRGLYSCSLRNIVGLGNSTNSVHINILYPPAVQATVSPATVNEGEDGSVSLTCDIVDGNPQNLLRVRWYKDDELQNEVTEKEIVWQNISRNFTANYSCEGENAAGWGNHSEAKELVVNYIPGPAIIIERNISAVKNQPMTLECMVEDFGRPSASVFHWEHLDEALHDTAQNLTIESVSLSSRGNYSCSAVNIVGSGQKGEFYLLPKAPPAVIVHLPDMHGAPSDAKNVSLTCIIECEPLCDIQWLRNKESIMDSYLYSIETTVLPEDPASGHFSSLSSTLQWNITAWPTGTLDRDSDNANYTCFSSGNSVGPGVSTSTVFKVEFPPENITLSVDQLDVVEGNVPEKINCSANSWPPSEYTWKFSNKIISNSSQLFLNETISRTRAGTYVCTASNKHGKEEAETIINILYKPDCNISEYNSEDNEAKLMCTAQANPAFVNFTWMKKNETMEDFVVVEGTKSLLTLENSVSGRRGKYYCIVNNTVGESVPCTLELKETVGAAGWHGDDSIIIIAAAVVAIIVLLIIIIIIVILLMKRKTRTGSKDTLDERETPEGRVQPAEATPVPKPGFRKPYNTNGSPNLKNGNTGSGTPKKGKSDGDPVYQNVTEADKKENGSPVAEPESRPMYENIKFHQKEPKGKHFLSTNNEGLVYADLSLPNSGTKPFFRKNTPTEYATLKFSKEEEHVDETFQTRHK